MGDIHNDITVHEVTQDKGNTSFPKKRFRFSAINARQSSLIQAAAGVAGISLGAIMMSIINHETEKLEFSSPELKSEVSEHKVNVPEEDCIDTVEECNVNVTLHTEAPFHDVNMDHKSFDQAFDEARKHVGPGGFFDWHGQTYNTYTKEEWDIMNNHQKNEFYSSVDSKHEPISQSDEEELLSILNDEDVSFESYEDIIILSEDDLVIHPQDIPDEVKFEKPAYESDEDYHDGIDPLLYDDLDIE